MPPKRLSAARARIRMAEVDQMLFGPDKLPYGEALDREWDRVSPGKQPATPRKSSPANPAIIEPSKLAGRLSPRRKGRYDGSLQHQRTSSATKEGTMPRRPAAPAVEETEEEEKDFTLFAEKNITPAAQALAEWLTENTGYEVDPRSVYLTMALRRDSRLDPANRERTQELAEERRAARKPTKAADVDEDEGEGDEEEEAPAKTTARRTRKPTVTTASSTSKDGTTASTRGRKPAAAATGTRPARGRKPAAAGAKAPF